MVRALIESAPHEMSWYHRLVGETIDVDFDLPDENYYGTLQVFPLPTKHNKNLIDRSNHFLLDAKVLQLRKEDLLFLKSEHLSAFTNKELATILLEGED